MSILRLFGFPPPEQRNVVRFYLAKNLPYNFRVNLMLMLLVVGFGLQILFMHAAHGAFFLLAGVALVLTKGYDSRVRTKGFSLDPNWKTVSIDKIKEIEQLRKQSKKWDIDALDISNSLGVLTLILIGGLALLAAVLLGSLTNDTRVTTILITDIAIFMVPLWFSGMRFILKQPNLAVKVKTILDLYGVFKTVKREGEEFRPALMLTKDDEGKSVPIDARFSVAFPNSPEGFYGLQAQINLNLVEGASYPYFYCALAAKPGFGLSRYKDEIRLDSRIICEYQQESKAEVLVIRQYTTRTSGYHTDDRQCTRILIAALDAGRKPAEAELEFRSACKESLADGKLTIDEKQELKTLAKSLMMSSATVKELFAEEKEDFLRNREQHLATDAELEFRRTCKKVLADGRITAYEKRLLKILAGHFKMSGKIMKRILKDEIKIFRQSHPKKHSG
jgi:hypothetical protein